MKKCLLSWLFITVFSTTALADEASVALGLSAVIPNISKDSVSKTPITGLYQVLVGARVIYASEDGRYIIQGEMVDLVNRKNMTEQALNTTRQRELAKIDEKSMIIFPAKNEKHKITIFSDIDCGYCRKLHAQINDYTDAGITVRYLLFPRTGPETESYIKAVSVWCAEDRNQALTDAKLNNKVINKTCENPVDDHMALGQVFGVAGTPAIIADNGVMIPGFVPAKELIQHVGW
ncbi:MAG: disulfide bond formation protein DsbC [Cycloclasticus sp.]|nr:disulfide bond formation protein DsbC [Cycloclasticus sp.]MBG97129.1 disulfide bond formation protein DsbC [Cycloclasticus sp.]HAI95824.1 disulfide bond formation protein DsbC [Methylococcaceae bacterium]|tara:strand:- start:4607 stop:5308 length:702 start_codon:yes stop_codon:yes gene_type:complete